MARLRYTVVLALLGSSVPSLSPAQVTWQVDTARSSVGFRIQHMVIRHVTGRFRGFEGTVVTRGEDFAGAEVTAMIEAKTIDTGREERDQNLRGEDFLHAAAYPRISFASRAVARTGRQRVRLRDGTQPRGADRGGLGRDPARRDAGASLGRIRALPPERVFFAWAGDPGRPGTPHYYRIGGPTFQIEYFNSGDHIHSLLRTAEDFGG